MAQFECKVTTHGERQLELDVAYPLVEGQKAARYELDLYIFSSSQLGMTKDSYGVDGFLHDMKSYTRYTTPSISISKLADPSCAISPLTRITEMLNRPDMARDLDGDAVLYELRNLANIYQDQVHHTAALLETLVLRYHRAADAVDGIRRLLSDVDGVLKAFRPLHTAFLDPRVSERLRESLRWADEAVSLSTEKVQYRLYDLCSARPELVEAATLLRPRLELEREYRESVGYPTVVVPDSPAANELVVYRESTLKKWAEGCMYMSTAPARVGVRVAQILMATAAGAAMVFAVVATLIASRWLAPNSVPWLILVVAAYIFKDRIKAVLRTVFIAYLPKLVADQIEDLIDSAAKLKVGRSRARVRFCRPADLPNTIMQVRNADGKVFRDIFPPENVIHFHKDVRIDCARLMEHHTRLASITEIMRFKLDSYRTNMDDPVNTLSCVVDGKPEKVHAKRVYHINMILSLSDKQPDGTSALFRHRLIISRDGIVRIEHL